ncbi:MAG TPA: MBOAT family O-acyltransferase, partial [Hanamia sp.]|nr:MBOAT family O-acyltransferase [Hanamia sp.]
MEFDSFFYVLFFLPFVFLLYQTVKHTRYHNLIICGASLTFYAFGQLKYLVILILISLQDYFIAGIIHKTANERKRKFLVALSVSLNLLVLAFFKYSDWLIDVVNKNLIDTFSIFRSIPEIPHLNLLLPIGISFYVFHTISYTVDTYRRVIVPRKNILDYLTFVSFFPLLVAGPIQRARDLLPQLGKKRVLPSNKVLEYGVFLILYGITKKIVIADNLGNLIEICQKNHSATPGLGFIIALAFTFQIYADFSAYTDIATGSAKLFNIKLTRNFITPYFSQSPSEFWQRWHICLSSWLRDYLYIPLGGNKSGKLKTYINLMVTMILGGIWHGAGVFFLLWGIYHGMLLTFYRIIPINTYLKKYLGKVGKWLAITIMFVSTVYGWILFFSKTNAQFHKLSGG